MNLCVLCVFSVLVILPPQVAGELKFSHRIHLAAGGVCEDCHEAAYTSGAASDNLLPGNKQCLACHRDSRITQPLPSLKREILFSHRQHLDLGNVAPTLAAAIDGGHYLSEPGKIRPHLNSDNLCVACHRGMEETDLATKEHLPQMADCLVCHSQIDPPFSCVSCHTKEVQRLKPADHTPDYIDIHSSPNYKFDKNTCTICHGRTFTCLGCH